MSKRRWRSTRDRPPKVGREILGWYGKGMEFLVVELDEDGRYYDDTGGEFDAPLLWMKIPKLPESAGGGS